MARLGRENPDTFQRLSTFREEEVLNSDGLFYGNSHGDHTGDPRHRGDQL